MDKLSLKIKVELENIDEVLKEMSPSAKLPYVSVLELAGVAALLHNFYNGIENIFKQIFISSQIPIPGGKSWHIELIDQAVKENILSEDC